MVERPVAPHPIDNSRGPLTNSSTAAWRNRRVSDDLQLVMNCPVARLALAKRQPPNDQLCSVVEEAETQDQSTQAEENAWLAR